MITAGFIGLGLIGGSIAKTLKKVRPDSYIIAFNRSHEVLNDAVKDKVVDEAVYEVTEAFSKCDIIFLCTPVELNSEYLAILKPLIGADCVVTDVGSVKGYIHRTVSKLNMEANFIGGHPMAGSEKTGYAAATDILLENAYYAITPTTSTKRDSLQFYVQLVKELGAVPIVVDPDTHDYCVAGISHLPHLIASSLVNLVKDNDTSDELMKTLAAGGFRDITRIASSSDTMWSQICATNKEQISLMLSKYIDYLTKVKTFVDSNDKASISKMFIESAEYRNSIGIDKKGPVTPDYSIFCDLEDREGALSSVTLLLSDNHISIKNIEIIHNREFKQGALFIAFYDEQAYNKAHNLLITNGYSIYR